MIPHFNFFQLVDKLLVQIASAKRASSCKECSKLALS